MYSLNGSLNLELENPRITANQEVVQEDSHNISVHAENHDTMYGVVNLEDTTEVTLVGVVIHDTNPFQPTFHTLI